LKKYLLRGVFNVFFGFCGLAHELSFMFNKIDKRKISGLVP
jgi:hypothetical protein